jgi:hypothetical protein
VSERVPDPVAIARSMERVADGPAAGEACDYCGATSLSWRKCKLICTSCSQINKSCADL